MARPLRGRRLVQASAIGVQWPGWCHQRRRRPGHGPDRSNAALATRQAASTKSSPGSSVFGDPVERLVGRVDFRARSISEIRASLTASSFGNTFATSGLRTMIFDSSFIRFEYLPRTRPRGKSDRLYSGRSSSLTIFLSFFIEFLFSFACFTSGNDSNVLALFGVSYHQKPPSFRNAKGNKPFFRIRFSLFSNYIIFLVLCPEFNHSIPNEELR